MWVSKTIGANKDLSIKKGDTMTGTLTFTQGGSPYSLAAVTATFKIYRPGETTPVLTLTDGDGFTKSGNTIIMRNDGSGTATKVDLGANAVRATTHGYDLIMYIAPNGSDLFVRIVNLHTGVTVLDTSYNTDLPAVNTGMAFKADVRNGAVAAADNLEVAKVYIETDF